MARKGFLFFMVMVVALMFSGAAMAAEKGGSSFGDVCDLGSWSDPTTGEIFKFVIAKGNDSIRLNQSIIYVVHTSVQKDAQTGKWMPKTDMIRADAASGPGIWNGFMQGGFGGLAQGAGLGIGMGFLRPSSVNTSAGTNNGQGQFQAQGQDQFQVMKNAQERRRD